MQLGKLVFCVATVLATNAPDVRADDEVAGGAAKWSYVPQGRTERFGHAEMIVAAPVQYVREQATDFAHYKDLSNGRIRTSRLVDKGATTTDVYLQLPVLHGMITLWQVLRFSEGQRAADGTETITGKLVSGNVRASEMTIVIRPAGAGRSVLKCDVLLTPSFATPQSALDAELADAAESAVRALASHAEQKFVLASPAPVETHAEVAAP